MRTLKHIKTSFRRYIIKNDIKPQPLLNHFIYFVNCFGDVHAVNIMFCDFEDYYYSMLKTVFHYMQILPDTITVNGLYIKTSLIETDKNLLKSLVIKNVY